MAQPLPRITVYFQDACLAHRFIRSRDASTVVERPQRLRAVKIGVATAIARLSNRRDNCGTLNEEDALSGALERLTFTGNHAEVVNVVMSSASVDILKHPAMKYVHGDVAGDTYLEKLVTLVRESEEKVARGESEIPEGLSQGDLYLCKESIDAIQGAIGTVCEAVDGVLRTPRIRGATQASSVSDATSSSLPELNKAFVAIRPPGHHCGEDSPSGFCFVNNVVVGAAHAHLKHGIARFVILDIDLHHGNGTQSIVWRINKETHNKQFTSEPSDGPDTPGPKIYYGSIHDVLSYPCEDGNAALIQAASVSLHGPHGQYIENVHLLPYEDDQYFWDRLYCGPYNRLLQKAEDFLKEGFPEEAMVFISAGFDASEHEYSSMSRHGRKVPTGFYHRFVRDVRKIADQYAKGRIVSVLEGGYSDRALCSGAMAHVLGLVEENSEVDTSWWSLDNLIKVEKADKKRRSGRSSGTTVMSERWIEHTMSILSTLCPNPSPPTPKRYQSSTMALRDRNKRSVTPSTSVSVSATKSRSYAATGKDRNPNDLAKPADEDQRDDLGSERPPEFNAEAEQGPKKLPRVILKVNPPVTQSQI